eukprot:10259227-Heterocapsa_arctica.AAC.1
MEWYVRNWPLTPGSRLCMGAEVDGEESCHDVPEGGVLQDFGEEGRGHGDLRGLVVEDGSEKGTRSAPERL